MQEIKKIIYFGTGVHFKCVSHFPNAIEFIFVDTQPRSEFDNMLFDIDYYDNTFIENLLTDGNKYNITLLDSHEIESLYVANNDYKLPYLNPTLLTFTNIITKQIIKYYVSTNIKYNKIPELLKDIKDSDALIVSGYYPDKIIYDYFDRQTKKQFIGYSRTCYKMNMEEMNDTIYCELFENKYFDKYYLVDYENGIITEHSDFRDFIYKKYEY